MIGAHATDFASFRAEARRLLQANVAPADVVWQTGPQATLFASTNDDTKASSPDVERRGRVASVPAAFVELAELACDHHDPDRFAVLYRVLCKLAGGAGRVVLDDPLDPDVTRLRHLVREVREEEHRMHAFVRFRPMGGGGDDAKRWVAWYRPAHDVLRRVAPFFARRYPDMNWALFTPDASAHWDGRELRFGPGATATEAPSPDDLDALFVTYYANVFNPARVNTALYAHHVPAHVRTQLPEASALPSLVRAAATRVMTMDKPKRSLVPLPDARDLESLRAAAATCRACPIGARATQTVFGEGACDAKLVLVGEQPGDEEDRVGRPFVGPAGRILSELLTKADIDRRLVYVTNAVKHFKWEPRGKRRLHSRPNASEVDACQGWLLAEIAALKPSMILCLGATAAQSFCGSKFRVERDRGKPMPTPWAPWWMATYHPSAVLRARDAREREAIQTALANDLGRARDHLATLG